MSGILALAAGFGTGYMQQQEREFQRKRQEKQDAQQEQKFGWEAQDRQRQDQERQAMQTAAKPIAMTEGAGGMVRPDTMDNRDVGLPENANQPNEGLMPVAYRVGAQPFASRNDAQAEVAMQNAPEARQSRRVMALEGMGRFDEADKARMTQMQLSESTRKYQDEGYSDALKALRSGDAAGAAAAFNKSGAMKVQGDIQLTPKEIDLPGHGKVKSYDATFNLTNPDGSVRPMTINSHDATMASMPYEKFLKAGVDASKETREGNESAAKANYYNALAGFNNAKADGSAGPGAKGGDKPFKMDEDDKLRFQESNKGVHEANKALNDAMSKLMPGDDPSKAPAIVHAQGLVRSAKLNQLKTGIQVGAVTPDQMANEIMGVAKAPADVMRSLSELANTVGADFSDQVGALIQGNDAWSRMNPKPRQQAPQSIAASVGAPVANQPRVQPVQAPAAQTPADTAGTNLDTARANLAALRSRPAPGMAAGREAIDAYAAKMTAAREAVAAAEAEYQKSLPQTGAAFGRTAMK